MGHDVRFGRQAHCPGSGWYVPVAHGTQSCAVDEMYVPGGHSLHAERLKVGIVRGTLLAIAQRSSAAAVAESSIRLLLLLPRQSAHAGASGALATSTYAHVPVHRR